MFRTKHSHVIAIGAIFALGSSLGFGAINVVNNLDSGFNQGGFVCPGCGGNYFAGYALGQSQQFTNFFTFDLTGVSGTVSAASFNLYTYGISGSTTPFDINGGTYALFAANLAAWQNTSGTILGPQVGSIDLSLSDSFTNLSIDLNGAGLAFLTANEGTSIVLTGSLVSSIGGSDFVFSGSQFTPGNNLTITTSPTPEPALFVPVGVGFFGLACLIGRRRKSVCPADGRV